MASPFPNRLVAGLRSSAKAFRDAFRSENNNARSGLNLNVGSGGYSIDGFTDVDIPSDWYRDQHGGSFAPYDMRKGKLPFKNNTVENIYCSHVIEHIEDIYVNRFFEDASSVLKQGGVLRVATPDAKFLWNVSSFENSYWDWRSGWFSSRGIRRQDCTQYDFMTREISTRKVRHIDRSFASLHDELDSLNFDEAMCLLIQGNEFDLSMVGNHINYWTFDKIRSMADRYFSYIVESKPNGSVSAALRGRDMDLKQPQMSLYVDLIK